MGKVSPRGGGAGGASTEERRSCRGTLGMVLGGGGEHGAWQLSQRVWVALSINWHRGWLPACPEGLSLSQKREREEARFFVMAALAVRMSAFSLTNRVRRSNPPPPPWKKSDYPDRAAPFLASGGSILGVGEENP
jgi:hypothetical protein